MHLNKEAAASSCEVSVPIYQYTLRHTDVYCRM